MARQFFLFSLFSLSALLFFEGFSDLKSSPDLLKFGRKLEKALYSPHKNLIFSPWDLASLLALTGEGAKGKTKEAFWDLLGLSHQTEERREAFKKLTETLHQEGHFELYSALSIWLQTGKLFNPLFQEVATADYQAALEQTNFQHHPDHARAEINHWVSKHTKGNIPELLKKGIIQKDSLLVLVSALYLNAPFLHPFSFNESREEDFNPKDAPSFPITFLHRKGSYRYLETEAFQLLEVPYQSDPLDVVLWVMLPKKEESSIDPLELEPLLETTEVDVKLPKMEVRSTLDLRQSLIAMGFTLPFSPQADFSEMVSDHPPSLSAIIHEAYMGWDERGTEAAAASAAVFIRSSLPKTAIFHANRPFSFLIWDKKTGIPLFQGRVVSPTPWKGRNFLDKNRGIE